ncbi:dipeptidase PepV [Brevibacillus ginsengisoli]|uniref:dipeptidase PepV n=1 Tax=Brevibacillus ginsengisoli TaxID=363854 RepID=UPI003CFB3B83
MTDQQVNWMAEVEKRKADLIATTQEFLRIKSVLDEASAGPNAPFGQGIADALNFILKQCEEAGMVTKNVDGYAGHAEFGAGEELVGILSHVDVVPEGDGWTTPPYAAEIVDDKIVARGALDDKGPTVAAFFAAKIVKELGLPLNRRVRLIFGADEETSWRCMHHYFKHEEMPTLGFTPDADFPLIYAEKGLTHLIFKQSIEAWKAAGKAEKAQADVRLLSLQAGRRMNMVPDLANAVLIPQQKTADELVQLFEAYMKKSGLTGDAKIAGERVELSLKGVSVHGMDPAKGINAGTELVHFLHKLQLDTRAEAFVQFTETYLYRQHYGEAMGIDHNDPEMGPLTLNTGVLQYEAEGEIRFDINIRYPHSQPYDKWEPDLLGHLKNAHLALEIEENMAPHHVELSHPLITTLQRIYSEQTGLDATAMAIGGATYGRSLDVGVAFGPLFPGRPDCAHQRDEHIFIEDLVRSTAIYAQAIYELAQG